MKNILVSIVVITYNSSKYILETLESARNQTHRNIELIISDDNSSDDTVSIVSEWLARHTSYFNQVRLITSHINTGIPANCNHGIGKSHGKYIKIIAGDDVLLDDCIENNLINVIDEDIDILFSNVVFFSDSGHVDLAEGEKYQKAGLKYYNKSAKYQYNQLVCKGCFPVAPTAFIKKDVFKVLDGFDESIRFIEDYPFWIKATSFGFTLNHVNLNTVRYRVHERSISGSRSYFKSKRDVFYKYQIKHLEKRNFLKSVKLRVYYFIYCLDNRYLRGVAVLLASDYILKKVAFLFKSKRFFNSAK